MKEGLVGCWTRWRLLARGREWFDHLLDYDGPSCYELGTGGPRGGGIQQHYIGETMNEQARMTRYARSGSHLAKIIEWHLKQGWCLYYRGYQVSSKAEAVAMERSMLKRFRYDWNERLNRDD